MGGRSTEAICGAQWARLGIVALGLVLGFPVLTSYALAVATASLSFHDLLLVAAVVVAAFGYAEGGLLAREIGAWQTISWALVLGLP